LPGLRFETELVRSRSDRGDEVLATDQDARSRARDMLVGRTHGEVDVPHLVRGRLIEESDARSHVRVIDIDQRLTAAWQRERLLELREGNVPLGCADRRNQQKTRRARRPCLRKLRVAVK